MGELWQSKGATGLELLDASERRIVIRTSELPVTRSYSSIISNGAAIVFFRIGSGLTLREGSFEGWSCGLTMCI